MRLTVPGLAVLFIYPIGSERPWFRIKRQLYVAKRTGQLWVKFANSQYNVVDLGDNSYRINVPQHILDGVESLRIVPARRV